MPVHVCIVKARSLLINGTDVQATNTDCKPKLHKNYKLVLQIWLVNNNVVPGSTMLLTQEHVMSHLVKSGSAWCTAGTEIPLAWPEGTSLYQVAAPHCTPLARAGCWGGTLLGVNEMLWSSHVNTCTDPHIHFHRLALWYFDSAASQVFHPKYLNPFRPFFSTEQKKNVPVDFYSLSA